MLDDRTLYKGFVRGNDIDVSKLLEEISAGHNNACSQICVRNSDDVRLEDPVRVRADAEARRKRNDDIVAGLEEIYAIHKSRNFGWTRTRTTSTSYNGIRETREYTYFPYFGNYTSYTN